MLRQRIVVGLLAPRAALVERTLAASLGVGRSTVRAALHLLEREGYVVTEEAGKYSRAIVAPLSLEDMQETHELLAALIGMAARRNASLDDPARAALVDDLVEINGHLKHVARSDPTNFSALFEADSRFHLRCLDAAASRRLTVLHSITAPQGERYGRMYATVVIGKGTVSAEEHERIIEAIRRADAEEAQLSTVTNFLNAADRLREVIERVGQSKGW